MALIYPNLPLFTLDVPESKKVEGDIGVEISSLFSAVNFNSLQTCIFSIFSANLMNDPAVISTVLLRICLYERAQEASLV